MRASRIYLSIAFRKRSNVCVCVRGRQTADMEPIERKSISRSFVENIRSDARITIEIHSLKSSRAKVTVPFPEHVSLK